MPFNQHQNNESVRAQTFKSFMEIDKNKLIYATYGPFAKRYSKFKVHFAQFEQEAVNKNKSSIGSATKGGMKKSIAKRGGLYLGLTGDYATDINDEILRLQTKFSETDIIKMMEGDILPFIQSICLKVFTTDLMTNIAFKEYEITELQISTLLADAILYNSKIGNVNSDDNSSSVANDILDDIIDLIHLDFDSMDITVKTFEEKNSEFVYGYHKNKALIKFGTRHEGIAGVVRKKGVLQPDAFVGVVNSDKSTTADSEAKYLMYLVPGLYKIQAKNADGDFQEKDIEVTYRTMGDVDFDLE